MNNNNNLDDPLNNSLKLLNIQEDDPYYDNKKDERNNKWVQDNISHGNKSNTDAILNCPCCFVILCIDCQRHNYYNDQYRAMFVSNCKVNCNYQVIYEKQSSLNKKQHKIKWKQIQIQDASQYNRNELYYPVQCTYCDTEVAVYDYDEIYHFYNVIVGY